MTRLIDRGELMRKEFDSARGAGLSVGFVPTMGALHEGHLSLIRRSVSECDVTAVSIFVNPLQFGAADDLAKYPRDIEGDLPAAYGAGADVVFAPTVEEMYPAGDTTTSVHVGGLSDVLEGASRPGHFDGVATVVAKLFNVAGACRAYFGEKDYQQVLVVRRMATDLSFPVEVLPCPTVREPDGLACSSRNLRLGADDRRAAAVLHGALLEAARAVESGERRGSTIRETMSEIVRAEPRATLDYAEVVAEATLEPMESVTGQARLLVAAHFGDVRLIDNLPARAAESGNARPERPSGNARPDRPRAGTPGPSGRERERGVSA